jgi:hypothetical protein
LADFGVGGGGHGRGCRREHRHPFPWVKPKAPQFFTTVQTIFANRYRATVGYPC